MQVFVKIFSSTNISLILSETCTSFVILIMEIFSERPKKDDLKAIIIDRACDVHPYIEVCSIGILQYACS